MEQLTLSNINDIFNYFKLPKSSKSCMPSRRGQEEELDLKMTNRKKRSVMINITSKCIDQILNIICPGPSQNKLRKTVASRIQYKAHNTFDTNNNPLYVLVHLQMNKGRRLLVVFNTKHPILMIQIIRMYMYFLINLIG